MVDRLIDWWYCNLHFLLASSNGREFLDRDHVILSSLIVIIVNIISNARKGYKANVYIKLNQLANSS